MPNKFISEGILSRVVSINQDSEEYKRYTADLNTSNNENDLYHALGTVRIENTSLSNSYIYTYVNEARQNLYLKLISAINNLPTTLSIIKNSNLVDNDTSQLMLIFNLNSNYITLND